MSDPEHPIVEAVKADPIVKAALETSGATERRAPSTTVTQAGDLVAMPTTTEEQDRGFAGNRAVNLLWETTQRQIAMAVILVALSVAAWLAVAGATDNQVAASVFLYGVANLVIGFYFGRTNHTRVGGVTQER